MKDVLFAMAVLASTSAAAFPAHVDRCHDGDTCTLNTGVRIRLGEIDAPEIDHPFGTQARDLLCSMVCGQDVDIEPRGTSYDRVVGLIRVGGLYTSEAMVAAGAAWDYVHYNSDPTMPGLEAKARAGRLGSWADPSPVPPWEWRHRIKPQ